MKKLIIPALLLLAITACKKKTEVSNPVTATNFKTYSSMDEVFALLASQSKVVIFDAANGASFYGNSGTRYIFQPSCFIDASGALVTGNVQVEVTEYLKKGDMIFSGVLPISNGEPLLSGGEFNVRASKNGQELFIKTGIPFQTNIPQFSSKDTVMNIFRGIQIAGDITDKVNWRVVDTGKDVSIDYERDTLKILSDSLNYCNADKFIDSVKYQDFNVSVIANNATVNYVNFKTYALYDTYKGLWQLRRVINAVYQEGHVPGIPVHFVSFGLINGHFYGGVTAATPKTGQTYTIALTEVDPNDFKAQINGLY